MTLKRDFPYSADDLRKIADKLDEIIDTLGEDAQNIPEDHWLWGLGVAMPMPDDPDGIWHPIGCVAPYSDGWIGFYPYALTKEDNRD